jgi:hypothetical protein
MGRAHGGRNPFMECLPQNIHVCCVMGVGAAKRAVEGAEGRGRSRRIPLCRPVNNAMGGSK